MSDKDDEEVVLDDDDEVLWGAAAIGAAIKLNPGQTWHQLNQGSLPAVKVGGKWASTRGALRKRFRPKGFRPVERAG